MEALDDNLINKIVKLCINQYRNLPKTGKPIENEWTVLSCIVKLNQTTGQLKVVSLGTGSKCVGATKMSPLGNILNDSHAEVFARRGFLLYLYDNIQKADSQSIFKKEGEKFKLKDDIQFIFYSSQIPCGDASITPKKYESCEIGDVIETRKRLADEDLCEIDVKKQKDVDIHRTGAKCLPDADQDLKQPGVNYHLTGQVRTKPGRGYRTQSVSCSDKMARWVHVGIQGSLLEMLLVNPIYIKHFIFGGGVSYSEDSLKRSLLYRNCPDSHHLDVTPNFYQSSVLFFDIKTDVKIKPAPGSIVWVDTRIPITEVAVQGKKLGVTKKKANNPNFSLCISKYHIYKRFVDILNTNKNLNELIVQTEDIVKIPYNEMKRKSIFYINKWLSVKEKVFKIWTVKPDMFNFCINNENEK